MARTSPQAMSARCRLSGVKPKCCSGPNSTLLTHKRHWPVRNPAAQQSPGVAEVCYPFCRKHGRHRALKRREFITLVGGAAIWPLAARSQQPERMRRIGVLLGTAADDQDSKPRLA